MGKRVSLPKYPTRVCADTPGSCPKCDGSSWREEYRPACGFVGREHTRWECSNCGYHTDTRPLGK